MFVCCICLFELLFLSRWFDSGMTIVDNDDGSPTFVSSGPGVILPLGDISLGEQQVPDPILMPCGQ